MSYKPFMTQVPMTPPASSSALTHLPCLWPQHIPYHRCSELLPCPLFVILSHTTKYLHVLFLVPGTLSVLSSVGNFQSSIKTLSKSQASLTPLFPALYSGSTPDCPLMQPLLQSVFSCLSQTVECEQFGKKKKDYVSSLYLPFLEHCLMDGRCSAFEMNCIRPLFLRSKHNQGVRQNLEFTKWAIISRNKGSEK